MIVAAYGTHKMDLHGIEAHYTLDSRAGGSRGQFWLVLAKAGLRYRLGVPLDRSILPQVEFFALAGSLAWVPPFALVLGQICKTFYFCLIFDTLLIGTKKPPKAVCLRGSKVPPKYLSTSLRSMYGGPQRPTPCRRNPQWYI